MQYLENINNSDLLILGCNPDFLISHLHTLPNYPEYAGLWFLLSYASSSLGPTHSCNSPVENNLLFRKTEILKLKGYFKSAN